MRVPAPALFLLAAALASDAFPRLYDLVSVHTAEQVAIVALVVILFDGGIDIGWARIRGALAPILSIGLIGTFLTAGALALFCHAGLGLDWTMSGLIGAALAATDPAVTFSVLGGREIEGRSGTVLEGEAGFNDPAGIALMAGMIELATHDDATGWVIGREFLVQMVVGVAFGVLGIRLLGPALRRAPVLALPAAGVLYVLTDLVGGSGFLAVFLLGLVLADQGLAVPRVQTHLAGAAEVVVFVALGLTIHLDALSFRDWWQGLAIFAVLAFVVRPLVVAATLGRADMARTEKAFIAWSGLKGAVPILLAAMALLHHAGAGPRIYSLVFVVVLASVVGQGTPVPWIAARLRIPMH
ncbi:cation:proton antiporter [Conexibacter woesei]|uniref:cation:proton antiporter domain-containing protein n=1 Tax=Conexibacter woesei TaxID=191495 RepID=UPI0009DC05B9|nr:cation:proton antiporter [Conexibacter woesei]